jgi:hypothetical protein
MSGATPFRPYFPSWTVQRQLFESLFRYGDIYVGGLRKTTINLNKDSRCLDRNSNPLPSVQKQEW